MKSVKDRSWLGLICQPITSLSERLVEIWLGHLLVSRLEGLIVTHGLHVRVHWIHSLVHTIHRLGCIVCHNDSSSLSVVEIACSLSQCKSSLSFFPPDYQPQDDKDTNKSTNRASDNATNSPLRSR